MNREPIQTSLLDQDTYKFSMSQFILHRFPALNTEWKWKCRSKGIDLRPFADEIREEIYSTENLRFEKDEVEFLRDLYYITNDYADFLRVFRPYPREYIQVTAGKDNLEIHAKGPWLHVSPFEIPILYINSEVWTRNMYPHIDYTEAEAILKKNAEIVNQNHLKWSCFGTRRRANKAWQEHTTKFYKEETKGLFNGTSNTLLAKKYSLTPIGTMAHEIFQVMQVLVRVADSQKFALENWVQEYRGNLGIALTDIFGIDAFIKDFDLFFAKLFNGVRHDSGDPFEFGEKIIQMYKDLKIDPQTKSAVFTDSLTFEKAALIKERFNSRIDVAFGIGTNVTNDLGLKYPPLQQVMKVIRAGTGNNLQPTAKVSDSQGKGMCEDEEFEKYVRHVIKQKVANA